MNTHPVSTCSQATPPPRVRYCPAADLPSPKVTDDVLAVLHFGTCTPIEDDPRHLRVPLQATAGGTAAPGELWQIDARVDHGREGAVQWSCGGGWLFAALNLDERTYTSIEDAAEQAYTVLCDFLSRRPQRHVQRVWNYFARINEGQGDNERYRRFCTGRLRGMRDFFADGFPAATAIGHRLADPLLQVYVLAAEYPGLRVENPRQINAWRYPRQYGPTPPSFARAMRLHGENSLAISGTAAITGHASLHPGDLEAQLKETYANLVALLEQGGLPARFTANDPLKVYLRHARDADAVQRFLDAHAPDAPRLLLLGDVCRRELLVEIDGWRFAH